jgi:hypothetical protein
MLCHSSILSSVFVNEAPCVLVIRITSNPLQELKATLLEVMHSCLVSRYQWEGRWLRFKDLHF